MVAIAREREARSALNVLGPMAVTNFLRAANVSTAPLAVRLANRDLDEGRSLEALLFTGEKFGYQLSVKPIAAQRFEIAFGCIAGPTEGDGGEWVVAFDEHDRVLEMSGGLEWMA